MLVPELDRYVTEYHEKCSGFAFQKNTGITHAFMVVPEFDHLATVIKILVFFWSAQSFQSLSVELQLELHLACETSFLHCVCLQKKHYFPDFVTRLFCVKWAFLDAKFQTLFSK